MHTTRLLIVCTSHVTQRSFLLPYARHFRARGWQVDALAHGASTSPECREAFDRVIDIDWTRNPLLPRNLLHAPRAVRAVVREGAYDLVHVHTPVAAFVTRLALRNRGEWPRVIYTAHGFHFYRGGDRLKNTLFLGLEKLAGRWTDYLVVMNGEDLEAARRHAIVPADRVRYMPGIGIDLEEYGASSVGEREVATVRRELGLGEGDFLFLNVAEFISRKRHSDLLRAFARLGRKSVCLALAGSGPLEAQMKGLADSLGISDRVRFLGYRRDIPALIAASGAMVLPSRQEGLPRCIMEAFCLGRICVGSDIRGTRDLVGKDCGLLAPVGDVDALARAMAWVLDHPREVEEMGRAARERIRTYGLDALIRLHEDLYEEALSLRPAVSLREGWSV